MLNRYTRFLRQAILGLLLMTVATLVTLGLCEILIRIVAPQQLIVQRPDLYEPSDSVGYKHRSHVHLTVNTGDRPVTMYTDSSGFRVGAQGRPAAEYRILLLGDSFMAAMQVEYEQSMPGLIGQCFLGRTGKTAAVWNAGVAGWDPPQYWVEAGRALASGQYDAVVVSVFLGNDVVDRLRFVRPYQADQPHHFRFPRALSRGEIIDAWLYPVNDILEHRSHLFVFFKNRLQTVLMRMGLTPVEVPANLRRSEANSPRWGVTADILAGIDSMAKLRKIPTLYMLIPAIEQVVPSVLSERAISFNIDTTALDLDQPDRLMTEELHRRHLRVVSLLPLLRDAQKRGVDLYGKVDMHPSADGQRVMWNGVAPLLAETLGLPYNVPADTAAPCGLP